MTVTMTGLRRAKNGDWFSRKAIPDDVRDAYQTAYGIRREERFRLSTDKSPGEAKAAFAEWLADIEGRISALRAAVAGKALELSHRQLHDLVGRWYDWFVVQYADDQEPVEAWDFRYERYQDAVEAFGGDRPDDDEDWERSPRHAAKVRAVVLELSRLQTFLASEGISLSSDTLDRLVDTLEADLVAAMALLRRRAGGDYRPDTHRERFPQSMPIVPASVKLAGWNVQETFEAYVRERQPQPSTVNRWRVVFLDLNDFLDRRDIALMTEDDAVGWKDKLVAKGDMGARTINEVWLTSARTVFNWAKRQKKIAANPFDGVKVATGRKTPTKGAFKPEDVKTILTATLQPQGTRVSPHFRAAIRWVPWLCGYTGARVGEITQLRKQDIEWHPDGFWALHITPEAGAVKGAMPRTVPLHDHLIEQGFIEFVRKAKDGPLFYDPKAKRKTGSDDAINPTRPPYVLMRQKLADWVRGLGVTDKGVSPLHAWRHTFKRRAAKAKIEERIRDAFCGHTDPKVGRIYEIPDIEELADAIKAFPRYEIDQSNKP
ncbi:tyrosine-type recombinase/integrase [Brucella pseudintermedia]|uniref:Tyrosine-type recombinase/integrase n=1 Tax=Brucella pseudintermedia TaxID=370111 RepID=A0ABY5UFZ2_9HYPH|nr:tyrosine-type recombinase/integrase [Brucella pseudintermedia]UWL60720.1 tyrosine-type recombinase/integrase [Brucella pseudintermedia]